MLHNLLCRLQGRWVTNPMAIHARQAKQRVSDKVFVNQWIRLEIVFPGRNT